MLLGKDKLQTTAPESKVYKHKTLKDEIKGALSGLRQFLTTKTPLKMMKNAFYFISKALLVLEIFKFLS